MCKDFIFAPKAGKRRDPCYGDRADQKQSIGPWDFGAEAAHFSNVLLPREGMDHRSGREKQKGLEEGMGHEVEYCCRIGPNPARENHITELTYRRIGQDSLNVR